MKKNSIVFLLVSIAILSGIGWWYYTEDSTDVRMYTIPETEVAFQVPDGWYVKTYPSVDTIIFLSPDDFHIPEAWGGPLTPLTVVVHKNHSIDDEAHRSLIKNEPHLEVEEITIDGYSATRVSGVPKEAAYLAGSYYEDISIQRDSDTVEVTYFGGGDEEQKYRDEYISIVESLTL